MRPISEVVLEFYYAPTPDAIEAMIKDRDAEVRAAALEDAARRLEHEASLLHDQHMAATLCACAHGLRALAAVPAPEEPK